MRRREFLRRGLAGLGAVAGAGAGALPGWRAPRALAATGAGTEGAGVVEPIVVSTWSHGIAANRVAWQILQVGGKALTAAERGVMVSEADPGVTSVGYGGWPNRDGVVQLDAAIQDGDSLEVGAVAGLEGILHPVAVARKVLEETPHTLLVGEGARSFALSQGFETQDLLTEKARAAWEKWKSGKRAPRAGSGADAPDDRPAGDGGEGLDEDNHDTLGMVVLDRGGHMAASCTTSGAAWKLPGRVGDSPIVGHGLYVDSSVGGVVATGLGEEVAKICGAFAVVERMRQGVDPEAAVREILERAIARDGKNRQNMIAMVALRRDGVIGAGSITPGFQVAITRNGVDELVDVPALVPAAKKG